MGLLKWFEGKRTYITGAIIIALSCIDVFQNYCAGNADFAQAIPAWVFSVLGALVIVFRRIATISGTKDAQNIMKSMIVVFLFSSFVFCGCSTIDQAKKDYQTGKADAQIMAIAEHNAEIADAAIKQTAAVLALIPQTAGLSVPIGSISSSATGAVVAALSIWILGRKKRKETEV